VVQLVVQEEVIMADEVLGVVAKVVKAEVLAEEKEVGAEDVVSIY
jgi:hypothetical protein